MAVVSVVDDQWCWKSKSVDVEVVDRDLASIDFTQTGFMLSASLSHSILLVRMKRLNSSHFLLFCTLSHNVEL